MCSLSVYVKIYNLISIKSTKVGGYCKKSPIMGQIEKIFSEDSKNGSYKNGFVTHEKNQHKLTNGYNYLHESEYNKHVSSKIIIHIKFI